MMGDWQKMPNKNHTIQFIKYKCVMVFREVFHHFKEGLFTCAFRVEVAVLGRRGRLVKVAPLLKYPPTP